MLPDDLRSPEPTSMSLMDNMKTSIKEIPTNRLKGRFIIALLVVAALINYMWELLQSPFYAGMRQGSSLAPLSNGSAFMPCIVGHTTI